MSAHARMCAPAWICVCAVSSFTAREAAESLSIVGRGHKGTGNEPGTLLLLLKLKMWRDVHGNESVSWSLTRFQQERKQIAIGSVFHIQSELSLAVRFVFFPPCPDKRFVGSKLQ